MLKWLLDSDPAIRWQALRDLTQEPADAVAAERSRVAREGWGAQLLAQQRGNGQWGKDDDRRGWMQTIFALVLLKDFGVDPQSEEAQLAVGRIREQITWFQLDGRPFFEGETEPCLNGRILGTGAYFGVASERLFDRLLSEQLVDGGWNCDAPPGTRSSFHTTICVLEGLLEYEKANGLLVYEKANGGVPAVTAARKRAEDYLLERQMLRSARTGEVIDKSWLRFAFPPTWHYDVLRGLDYLRSAGVTPDKRIAEAVGVVKQRQHQNGLWPLNRLHPDRFPFDLDTKVGAASYWNTLRGARVLAWAGA